MGQPKQVDVPDSGQSPAVRHRHTAPRAEEQAGTRKPCFEDYPRWLSECRKVDASPRSRTHYESVVNKVYLDFTQSNFWSNVLKTVKDADQRYLLETEYHLLAQTDPPAVLTKPYGSFLHKTYRRNVLLNPKWPEAPDGGWILPPGWCSRINDCVRTMLVVKYLDGVEHMCRSLAELASNASLACRVDYEAKPEGYYAAHLYVEFPCEVPNRDFDTVKTRMEIEFQVTTQLQEVIRRLLHKYYEQRRALGQGTDARWQWEYRSTEFATNYLGHILHYMEGMILDVRERGRKETPQP